jgi:hypothetical protein
VKPEEAIRRFLDALDVPPQRVPADLDAQSPLYRTVVADKRMPIVLDNARDVEQVRPLLPGTRRPRQYPGLAAAARLAELPRTGHQPQPALEPDHP